MATPEIQREKRLHEGTVLWGFIVGLITGIVGWMWLNPRNRQEWREDIASQIENDPIEDRMAEGKAAVRQLRHQTDDNV